MRQDPTTSHPDHIGPYRLLRVLGEGGMGIVYEAEQRVTIHRKVAVKVMKPGLDTKEVIGRFEAERQALAVMEHPGIAKVLDAGATEEGRPYFVMELVHGQSLRDYADARKLSIRERLKLFVRVCHAVQHAHHKGVIHRDLKPSNILVEEREGTATPRVIDFGIAKATGQRLSEVTLVTQLGQALGTPAYMSPEQAEASGLDVDMRTDVYSLGVTLYELLVGRLPIDPAEVGPQGFMYQLLLRESDPPTPSTRYRTLEDAYRDAVAGFRSTDPGGLRKELSGDLDCIVMKALEKDRDRRYDTVNALALDLQRHLRHEPVWASSPNLAYRVRKFVRRHRVGVTAGAAVAVALLAGSILATAGMLRAQRAERLAENEAAAAGQIATFLENVFVEADPYVTHPESATVRDVLDRGARTIRVELSGQPEVQARLMHVMGRVYNSLAMPDDASSMLEPALALQERLYGPTALAVSDILNDLGESYWRHEDHDRADTVLRRALAIRERERGPFDTTVANVLDNLAAVCGRREECTEAEELFRRALGSREAGLGPDHLDVAWSLNNFGAYCQRQGAFTSAEPLLRRALAIFATRLGPDDLDVAFALNNLGNNLVSQERAAEAEPYLARALAIRERRLPPDHYLVAASLNNLATCYYASKRMADALPLFRKARAIWEPKLPPDHPDMLAVLGSLGRVYTKLDSLTEAEPLTRRVLSILEESAHPSAEELSTQMLNLADIYRDQGRYRDAEELYRRAIRILQQSLPEHPLMLDALDSYATLLRREGNAAAADSLDAVAAAASASKGKPQDTLPD